MDKRTKNQKRKEKVKRKKISKQQLEQRMVSIEAEKIRRANQKILDAVEVAVERAVRHLGVPGLAARQMLADIIKDHLFTDIPKDEPAKESTKGHVPDRIRKPAMIPKAGFDKNAWQPDTNGESPPVADNPASVLEKPVAFDRGAWGQG